MLDFLLPKGRVMILRIMRYGGLLLIFNNAILQFHRNKSIIAILLGLIIFTGANDFIRERFLKNKSFAVYSLSFILSSIISAYLSYKVMCNGTVIYNIVLIVDLMMFDTKIPAYLLILNFITYCIPYKINSNPQVKYNLEEIFLNYAGTFIIVYIMRSFFLEKVKASNLNKDLQDANLKLTEYSERIKEYTVSKERTRIAQELHDSIGHSLIALNMNLEYAENIVDLNPEKAKGVIIKAHNMSKDCIVKLREVVSVLKEDTLIDNLHESINKLFKNFHSEKYRFNLGMYEDIEAESPNIKNCIYKTIREGITNGIKHGDADTFDIEVDKNHDIILLKISNNGVGCDTIIKSNGTKGIEKRITDLDGNVDFYSRNGHGFTIEASIPVGGTK